MIKRKEGKILGEKSIFRSYEWKKSTAGPKIVDIVLSNSKNIENQTTLLGEKLMTNTDYSKLEHKWAKELRNSNLYDDDEQDSCNGSDIMAEKTEKKEAPEHIKDGVLSVAIWTNKTAEGKLWKSFTIQRSYQDKDQKWQNTTSLRAGDLLKMAKLLEKAYEKSKITE